MPMTLLIVDDSDLMRVSLRALPGSVAGIGRISAASTLGDEHDHP